MLAFRGPGPRAVSILPRKRTRRRYLPPALRHLLIALAGAAIAVFVSYLLRKVGY